MNKMTIKKLSFYLLSLFLSWNIFAATTTNLTLNTPEQQQKPPQALTGIGPITASASAGGAITQAPSINAQGYILMDANSGQILASKNPQTRMEPASLTKVMTMYVISQALKQGRIHLTDQVTISKEAWRTGGSRMFIQVGTQVPVQDLIHGIVIASGNDAAVAMAEDVGGSTQNFVATMNQTAQQLGMKNSHFEDVNGLPASNHYTTPYDLAILSRALINDFPEDYKAWYGQKWMEYNKIKQPNRNKLLWQDSSVDGIKTGFTNDAGYCLIASAQRNGMRLISVVMNAPTSKARAIDSLALLNWGFRNFTTHQLYAANKPLAERRVWFGKNKFIPLGLNQNLSVTIPAKQYENLKATMTINQDYLEAPIVKGHPYGTVIVSLNNQTLVSLPVVALQDNPKGNLLSRGVDHILQLFHHKDD